MPEYDTLGKLFSYLADLGVAGSSEREYYFSIVEGEKIRKLCLHGVCVPCSGPVEIRLIDFDNKGKEEEDA